jgi:hypothetical protein
MLLPQMTLPKESTVLMKDKAKPYKSLPKATPTPI